MSDQEKQIEILEQQFPSLSGSAFAAAREEALSSGDSVLESDAGVIYEVFPDGSRKRVKDTEPPTKMALGSKFVIR